MHVAQPVSAVFLSTAINQLSKTKAQADQGVSNNDKSSVAAIGSPQYRFFTLIFD
jgi:hypothetical protein